ncbi:N1R/p28-like protein [Mythimna separata entomopoxvirus 'L']|uniref:N1R/p28-like protein n=1 Tax=Mythimna separata entomopoxvirus 'L' TaxID=1293572 RepID=A0A916KQ46_9POXV|nr:N1R/p28-like protein [Mythimna separata entomopoxvirus 'L']CCU56285.1 N1R/p28-like protein [Mythimna separata entomopoxvirus 'L']
MENILIKSELDSALNYNSLSYLTDNFIYNFNEIFKYKNINIDVICNVDYPWFNGKNILIDGLEYTEQSAKCVLKRLDDQFKKYKYNIIPSGGNLPPNTNLEEYRKNKAIYINEPGLYHVVMHCTKESAKPFQNYILFDLLPSIRKLAQKKYLDIINNKQNNIDELTNIVKKISNDNDNQKLEISNIYKQNNELLTQNKLALNKLQELGINLIESKEEIKEINNKIDTIIIDRNIRPKDPKLHHKYLLLKNKNTDNEYKFIRAQDQYIKNNKSLWLEKFNIIIDETYYPNPIDLCSRLKSKIIDMDKNRINNIKKKNKYNDEELKDILDNRKPFIEINGNNFTLNRCSDDRFLEIVKSIENEQYNI